MARKYKNLIEKIKEDSNIPVFTYKQDIVNNELYATEAAITYLNISRKTFISWCRKLKLQPTKLPGDQANYYHKVVLDGLRQQVKDWKKAKIPNTLYSTVDAHVYVGRCGDTFRRHVQICKIEPITDINNAKFYTQEMVDLIKESIHKPINKTIKGYYNTQEALDYLDFSSNSLLKYKAKVNIRGRHMGRHHILYYTKEELDLIKEAFDKRFEYNLPEYYTTKQVLDKFNMSSTAWRYYADIFNISSYRHPTRFGNIYKKEDIDKLYEQTKLDPSSLYTIDQGAEYVGLSRRKFEKLFSKHKIEPLTQMGDNTYYFTKEMLEYLYKQRSTKSLRNAIKIARRVGICTNEQAELNNLGHSG